MAWRSDRQGISTYDQTDEDLFNYKIHLNFFRVFHHSNIFTTIGLIETMAITEIRRAVIPRKHNGK